MASNYTTRQTRLVSDRFGYSVELLIVHETAGLYPGDLNWLVGGPVSVNWFIAPNGELFCLDPKFRATAHAGPCVWGRHTNPDEAKHGWGWANLASEGVEVSGPNNGKPFGERQVQTLLELVRWRMQTYGLTPSKVVRHLDIAVPKGRKTDPKGLNWEWFQQQLQPPVTLSWTIQGVDRAYRCGEGFYRLYNEQGGLYTFGYPLSDEFQGKDTQGEACAFMRFENATFKHKPSAGTWAVRPMQLAEIRKLGLE